MAGKPIDWTPERMAEIKRMWLDDVPLRRIAEAFGCHPDTITNKARQLNLSTRHHMSAGRNAPPAAPRPDKSGRLAANDPGFSAQCEIYIEANIRESTRCLVKLIQRGIDAGTLRSPRKAA